MIRASAIVGAVGVALCTATAAQELRIASAAQTREALAVEDDWLGNVGPLQRAASVGRSGPVSPQEFRQALQQVVRECGDGDVRRWAAAFANVAPRFSELGMQLPPAVLLACTNGADSEGHPYTRGDAVFMPPLRGEPGPGDTFTLAHELFHIFSRHHPQVASRLYAQLGFREAPPLAWPQEWSGLRISDPDAPLDRHVIGIEAEGRAYDVMPVLVARRSTLQPGESFFSIMDVRLLAVQASPDGRSSVPLRRDGQLVWFEANGNDSYARQLGGNTGYVIHPEETTADNIALLVTRSQPRNPGLVERMRKALLSKAQAQ